MHSGTVWEGCPVALVSGRTDVSPAAGPPRVSAKLSQTARPMFHARWDFERTSYARTNSFHSYELVFLRHNASDLPQTLLPTLLRWNKLFLLPDQPTCGRSLCGIHGNIGLRTRGQRPLNAMPRLICKSHPRWKTKPARGVSHQVLCL